MWISHQGISLNLKSLPWDVFHILDRSYKSFIDFNAKSKWHKSEATHFLQTILCNWLMCSWLQIIPINASFYEIVPYPRMTDIIPVNMHICHSSIMVSNDIISRSIFRDILNALCIYNNNSNTSTICFHSLLLLPVKM